jgi:hypothetical protein
MKTCFKCNKTLPLSEFYAHPQMSQGCLNKCKTCTKAAVEARRKEKLKDPDWVIKEMERHRKKQERYRQLGKACVSRGAKKAEVNKRYALNNPHKKKAHALCQHLTPQPCEKCENPKSERHHDDYSKPKEVRWLCKKHHMEQHVEARKAEILARLT